MKPRFLLPVLLLAAAGCSGSSQAPADGASAAPPPTTIAAAPSPAGPSIMAEVVMIDTGGPSITLREGDVPAGTPKASDLKTGDRTIRVEPGAAASLATIKPGDRVRVTCSAGPPAVAEASPATGAAAPAALPPAGPLSKCDSVVAIAAAGAIAP